MRNRRKWLSTKEDYMDYIKRKGWVLREIQKADEVERNLLWIIIGTIDIL